VQLGPAFLVLLDSLWTVDLAHLLVYLLGVGMALSTRHRVAIIRHIDDPLTIVVVIVWEVLLTRVCLRPRGCGKIS
jgi:hypothetical protein